MPAAYGSPELGGLWQAIILGFVGLGMDGGAVTVVPRLPRDWRSVSFSVCFRGRSVHLRVAAETVRIAIDDGDPVQIRVGAATHVVKGGSTLEVPYNSQTMGRE